LNESPNYAELIDQEIWSFIQRTEQHYPPDAQKCSVEQQRVNYVALCNAFSSGYPETVSSIDDTLPADGHHIPVRRYSVEGASDKAYIVYAHGGGYVMGDLNSHDDVCAELCAQTNINLTAVDYRLCPEHKHPAAFDDFLHAVRFEANRLQRPILLCGDSAGGNLCAAVSHALRSEPTPTPENTQSPVKAQLLIYPELGGNKHQGSYMEHANAPMLTAEEIDFFQKIRVTESAVENDVTLAPLKDNDFSNLPRTLVVSAACDPLSDDGQNYCNAINHAGGQAQWRNEAGLVHGFLRARHSSQRASASFRYIVDSLRQFADLVC